MKGNSECVAEGLMKHDSAERTRIQAGSRAIRKLRRWTWWSYNDLAGRNGSAGRNLLRDSLVVVSMP